MTSEFNIIAQYFTKPTDHTDLGVGDDAALIRVADGMQLAISADMLVAGTHFFADAAPYDIGWKVLAVNVSDMAAMGAQPKWATLAIALPSIDEAWLAEFSRGFFACAQAFNVDLVGGDTTRGPLTVSVQIMGEVPIGKGFRRDGAKAGEDIWVSGSLGDAALALAILQNSYKTDANWQEDELSKWLQCLNRPQPRAMLGLALRGLATSCIDISDGLLADLGHILNASNLGATIHLEQFPVSFYNMNHLDDQMIQQFVLAGGDDYELCFTAPKSKKTEINQLSQQMNLTISCIGETQESAGLVVRYHHQIITPHKKGFDHFD